MGWLIPRVWFGVLSGEPGVPTVEVYTDGWRWETPDPEQRVIELQQRDGEMIQLTKSQALRLKEMLGEFLGTVP